MKKRYVASIISLIVLLLMSSCTLGANGVSAVWSIQTVDLTKGGYWSSLALDQLGNPHIGYSEVNDTGHHIDSYLKYASWNGTGWNLQTVDQHGYASYCSLAIDSAGNPHIAYNLNDNTDTNYYLKYASWTGSSWNILTVEKDGNGWPVSLALDSSGNPHISYVGDTGLKYASWNSSTSTWNIQTVDANGGDGHGNSLVLDSSGNPHISYTNYISSGEYQSYDLKYASWVGSTWNIQTVDQTGGAGYACSLALDSAATPHISYFSSSSALKYASLNISASNWSIQTIDQTGSSDYDGCSLAFDSAGTPNVSYYDLTSHDLKFATWNGTGWGIQIVDQTGDDVGYFSSLVFDSSGNPCISYYDNTITSLKYAVLSTAAPTVTPTATGNLHNTLTASSPNKNSIFTTETYIYAILMVAVVCVILAVLLLLRKRHLPKTNP